MISEKRKEELTEAFLKAIEQESGGVIIEIVKKHMRAHLVGTVRGLYKNKNGNISHSGVEKTIRSNAHDKVRSKKNE